MATTTPFYGWSVPTSTDLVKDGATAIETLGDAIDASMNTALGTKKAGMVLLNTTSFSGVSSVTLPASTFTATYEYYRLMINCKVTTGSVNLNARLVAAGTPNTSNNYAFNLIFMTTGSATVNGGNNTGSNLIPLTNIGTDDAMGASLDLYSPFNSARNTGFSALTVRGDKGLLTIAGALTVTTSYDSITFFPDSSTITGSISCFGYNK